MRRKPMIKYTKYLQASLKTICNISVERSSPHRIKMYHKNPRCIRFVKRSGGSLLIHFIYCLHAIRGSTASLSAGGASYSTPSKITSIILKISSLFFIRRTRGFPRSMIRLIA